MNFIATAKLKSQEIGQTLGRRIRDPYQMRSQPGDKQKSRSEAINLLGL